MQHTKLLIDYFNENSDKIKLTSSDLISLMNMNLPSVATAMKNCFKQPECENCQLPFSSSLKDDIMLLPHSDKAIGKSAVKDINEQIQGDLEEKLITFNVS